MTEDDEPPPPRQLPAGVGYMWRRIADDLAGRIRSGEWSYGDRLPNRDELAAEYGVADKTVRRAVRELEAVGLVEVLPSKGVYVVWAGHKAQEGTR